MDEATVPPQSEPLHALHRRSSARKTNSFRPAVCLIAGVLLATPAASIVYVVPTDKDLVRLSPLIVYGEVIGTRSARLGSRPATAAHVRVENVLKGRLSGSVVAVSQPGGLDGGTGVKVMGLPMLAEGDRVLLFLDEDGEVYRTVNLGLGIFFEVSSGGQTLLLRESSTQFEIASPDGTLSDASPDSPARDSARFRRWIADRAKGRHPRPDYHVAGLPEGPRHVASPYVVSTGPCAGELLPLRWDEFDRGGSVAFTVHGSQRGVPGGGLTEVQAAIQAWSKVVGASVSLSASASTEAYDYRMSIGFDDPDDWLVGSYDPSTGGALAATVVGFDCDVSAHTVPGSATRAYALTRAYIITQDGFHLWLEGGKAEDAGANLAEVMAHELGHAIGLAHACGVSPDGRNEGVCDSVTADAIMRASVGGAGRGARLGVDDENAVKSLYPVRSASPPAPEQEPEPQSGCTLVVPYWAGPTGGFTVRPAAGRNSVSLTCGGRTSEYMAENGLVTRLVRSSCRGTGLQLTGAAPGGWYWQHGDSNAAVAPLVCSDALAGPSAVVPGGVTADATNNGTLIRHDTARLIGIVPHLAGNECGEYVTPYWQGDGGVVVRPEEGRETVRVRVQCGRTWSTMTPSAGEDGVIAELVSKSYCTDDEGAPKQGRLTVTGAAPGGWYWVDGERNAAVGPLMCADLLGGPAAVDPGGVTARAAEDGTYFQHDANRLIGVVPHVAPSGDPPR